MTERSSNVLAAVLAITHVAVLMAPAILLAAAAEKGGVADLHGVALLVASGALGALYGITIWGRLRRSARRGSTVDTLIATFDGLVVLALGATLLLFAALGAYAPTATVMINEGWPLVGLWLVVQLVAVGLAELTRRGVSRWLRRGPREG